MVQVSMNLLDLRRTPLHVVFERVRAEAEQRGVAVLESELVGLLPVEALVRSAASTCGSVAWTPTRCSKPLRLLESTRLSAVACQRVKTRAPRPVS